MGWMSVTPLVARMAWWRAMLYTTNGQAVLDGTVGTFIDLPGGLISSYQSTTIEYWMTVSPSTGGWTYAFAFGTDNLGSINGGGNGVNYFHRNSPIPAKLSSGFEGEHQCRVPAI